MREKPAILLIGLRGSGKSSVGRALAARLGARFVDLDDVTPALLGCERVADAWAKHGEAEFRRAEAVALRRTLDETPAGILALGGGTPTAPGARDLIDERRRAGGVKVVYLRESPATLRERLRQGGVGADRPSLTGADPLDEIEPVFNARDGVYRAIADGVVEGAGGIEATVDAVLRAVDHAASE